MFAYLLIGMIVIVIICGIRSSQERAKHIVGVYDVGQHYRRGMCFVHFRIKYDDGKTKDVSVIYDSSLYHYYKNWNQNNQNK